MKNYFGFRRTVVFLVVLAGIGCINIAGNAETIWEKRQKALQQGATGTRATASEAAVEEKELVPDDYSEEAEQALQLQATEGVIDPDSITVPEQYGTIIETHNGTNGRLIVHVQDAHANYEAQKNLASIIESLIKDYGLNLVLREGRDSDLSLSHFREDASLEARKIAAEKLLRNGDIDGEDYLDLTSDYPISFQGIEDIALYNENKNALWEIDKFKDIAGDYVNKLIVASDAIKPEIYSEGLLALDSKKKDYDAEKIDLLEYYGYLYKEAEKNDIPLYTFPNFQNLIKVSELEKKIDLAKINDGTASDEMRGLYEEYRNAMKDLNINGLFKEEPLLEDTLQDILATSTDQKKLIRVSKALSIMKNLLRIKVVPEEYKYFIDNKNDFDPKSWADFLSQKSQELNISTNIPGNYYIISDNLPKIEQFYNTAIERERAFLKKTQGRIDKDGVKIGALIAGGFHTPTLTKLLADSGYSYVVISPKVTTETDEALYRSTLRRQQK